MTDWTPEMLECLQRTVIADAEKALALEQITEDEYHVRVLLIQSYVQRLKKEP